MHTKSHICHRDFGMGVDSPFVERVIHFGVPRTMERFFSKKMEELEGMGGLLINPSLLVGLKRIHMYCE